MKKTIITSIYYTYAEYVNLNDVPNGKSSVYAEIMSELGFGDKLSLKRLFTAASGCKPNQHVCLAQALKRGFISSELIQEAYEYMLHTGNKFPALIDKIDESLNDMDLLLSVFGSEGSLEQKMRGRYSYFDNETLVKGSVEIKYNQNFVSPENVMFYVPNVEGTFFNVEGVNSIVYPNKFDTSIEVWITKDQERFMPFYLSNNPIKLFDSIEDLVNAYEEI